MIVARRDHVLLLALILATCLLVNPQPVWADIESSTQELKACVEMHMPDERKKNDPKVKNLLKACKAELNEVIELVPPGTRQAIRHVIEQETDNKLKETGT